MTLTITLLIIVLTGLISYQAFSNRTLFDNLKHYPIAEHQGEYYRLFSCALVHGDMTHLFMNMYVLYEFGIAVEERFVYEFGPIMGRVHFVSLYILSIAGANIKTFFKHKDNPSYSAVGASGAISAVLFAYILFHPWSQLLLFFIIPMPAILAAILFLVWESYAGKKNWFRIDHDAHFFGAVFGVVYVLVIRPSTLKEFIGQIMEYFG